MICWQPLAALRASVMRGCWIPPPLYANSASGCAQTQPALPRGLAQCPAGVPSGFPFQGGGCPVCRRQSRASPRLRANGCDGDKPAYGGLWFIPCRRNPAARGASPAAAGGCCAGWPQDSRTRCRSAPPGDPAL